MTRSGCGLSWNLLLGNVVNRTGAVPVEIRTIDFWNTTLKRHRLSQLTRYMTHVYTCRQKFIVIKILISSLTSPRIIHRYTIYNKQLVLPLLPGHYWYFITVYWSMTHSEFKVSFYCTSRITSKISQKILIITISSCVHYDISCESLNVTNNSA